MTDRKLLAPSNGSSSRAARVAFLYINRLLLLGLGCQKAVGKYCFTRNLSAIQTLYPQTTDQPSTLSAVGSLIWHEKLTQTFRPPSPLIFFQEVAVKNRKFGLTFRPQSPLTRSCSETKQSKTLGRASTMKK